LSGLSVGDLISGRDRHAFLARLLAAEHQADPQASSQLLGFRPVLGLGRTGSVIPLEIGLSIIDVSDEDRIIVLTVNDVRERRAAEDRIRVSEERFRRLTALSTDFFWETDDQLRFSFVSQRDFAESVRKLRDRFLGRRFWEIEGVRPVSFTWQEFQSLTREHRPFRLHTYSATLDDGQTRHYTVSGEPIFDPSGNFIGYRGVVADITDAESARQEALEREQAQVKALREELERLRGGADNWSRLPVGEALYGTRAISSSAPEEFDKLLVRYRGILDTGLEARVLKIDTGADEKLRVLAEDLGAWHAGARDVIEIHQRAIATATDSLSPLKAKALVEEGRYVVLELMGRLLMFYRRYFTGMRGSVPDARSKQPH